MDLHHDGGARENLNLESTSR